jgi:hypothetical protein
MMLSRIKSTRPNWGDLSTNTKLESIVETNSTRVSSRRRTTVADTGPLAPLTRRRSVSQPARIRNTVSDDAASELEVNQVEALAAAISANDIWTVREMVQQRPFTKIISNYRDREGWTLLHLAAENTHSPRIVEEIINAGAKVNARDFTRKTPLHIAAMKSKARPVVHALIEHGAKLNAKDFDNLTPLDHAVSRMDNKAKAVAKLIRKESRLQQYHDSMSSDPWPLQFQLD